MQVRQQLGWALALVTLAASGAGCAMFRSDTKADAAHEEAKRQVEILEDPQWIDLESSFGLRCIARADQLDPAEQRLVSPQI